MLPLLVVSLLLWRETYGFQGGAYSQSDYWRGQPVGEALPAQSVQSSVSEALNNGVLSEEVDSRFYQTLTSNSKLTSPLEPSMPHSQISQSGSVQYIGSASLLGSGTQNESPVLFSSERRNAFGVDLQPPHVFGSPSLNPSASFKPQQFSSQSKSVRGTRRRCTVKSGTRGASSAPVTRQGSIKPQDLSQFGHGSVSSALHPSKSVLTPGTTVQGTNYIFTDSSTIPLQGDNSVVSPKPQDSNQFVLGSGLYKKPISSLSVNDPSKSLQVVKQPAFISGFETQEGSSSLLTSQGSLSHGSHKLQDVSLFGQGSTLAKGQY
ncbi:hypothetical protein DNTS_008766, partial [Danionella cerebrum]